MRIFVTGASGFIGSAVVPELIGAGHKVVGLARSDASAAVLTAAGAEVQRGDLDDLGSLRDGAAGSDGVIHLAFVHDFSAYEKAIRTDLTAIETLGAALEGSDRPLVIASGTLGLSAGGRTATEKDGTAPGQSASPRAAAADLTISLAARGVRSSVVRLSPSVHGVGDHGFMAALIGIARAKGVSGYIGDGANRWSAVHRLDAARLFRLAAEQAPAGSTLHGVADEGVPIRAVAELIGRHLDLPVAAVAPENAAEHFGWLGAFLGFDSPASSALTRDLLGWQPTGPGLLDDLEEGHYFREPSA
ncbi:Nucleoside-diphosphate-sugar epimerase [Streptomyces sp. DvalAA-14]|uniref:SDR family oxidoreductase n=1 Tax=unclassified Streptomyces TaxID=2593676 RepID=UPI00081B9A56|nr:MULTISPECIES: SDR family oxidoreductase [unclassified Streptomyces]MYS20006.1 NAD-dependent epimerase/dehydratase family protein [Streptomyces sp. SID4948]SCD58628.1 Nucleoside-diphosphate-sugar epimerase [Streptomyces sp. DvalAA-14]